MTDQTPTRSTHGGSLLEGLTFEKRKPVDADWSKRKRWAVGVAAGVLGLGALGAGGYFAWQNRPVSLPTTAEQAIATIQSGRVDRLAPERRAQYFAEAGRLLRDIPREQMREIFSEEDREAIGRVFQEQMAENLRQIARGEGMPEMPMFGPGGRRPGGDGQGRRDGDNAQTQQGESENQRSQEAQRRERFAGRLQDAFQNGDAQRTGLMGEFFTMMRARMEQNGGQGRPGGG